MKTFLFALSLISITAISISAFAGTQVDSLQADIKTYVQTQSSDPNHIINYADENGGLARAVLDPARANKIVIELSGEINNQITLKTLLNAYQPILNNYELAFQQLPGKYDAEYLDAIDSSYRLLIFSVQKIESLDSSQIKDQNMRTMIEASQKMMATLPGAILSAVDQKIKANKFSPDFIAQAESRLEMLRILSINTNTHANASPESKGSLGIGTLEKPAFDPLPFYKNPAVTYKVTPAYPKIAQIHGICGEVDIALAIANSGEVIDQKIVASNPPQIFDAAVLNVIHGWKFEQKPDNTNPAPYQTIFPFKFSLTGNSNDCLPNTLIKTNTNTKQPQLI